MSSIWGEFESTVNQRLIEIVAKQAHQTLERELRARQVDFRIDSLASIWQGLLSSLSARHCERLLVEWGDVMGKPKGARYVTKPPVVAARPGLQASQGTIGRSSTAEGTVDGSSVADNAGPIWVFTGSPGSVEDNQALKAI
ncbi:hypothetical protein N7494_013259 [Penicillium frequentans]|uniref:Uncharacterized protein n=1 Tax=Penicillium frequentans TaxID=3151616 RepID=A0AAD6CHH2_9EURO|nr:hypothetical protein N7494_013259 [Penicillium glabrum]